MEERRPRVGKDTDLPRATDPARSANSADPRERTELLISDTHRAILEGIFSLNSVIATGSALTLS